MCRHDSTVRYVPTWLTACVGLGSLPHWAGSAWDAGLGWSGQTDVAEQTLGAGGEGEKLTKL